MLNRLLQWFRRKPAAPRPPAADATPQAAPAAAPAIPAGPAPTTPLLLDVRTEREYASVSLQGSVHLPLSQLADRIGEIAPDRRTPLQVVCASGARSSAACMLLRQLGYTDVTNAGGLYAAAAQLGRPIR